MAGTKSRDLIKGRRKAYGNFRGVDSERDPQAMDTGDKQYLLSCNNAYVDHHGRIVTDPPVIKHMGTGDTFEPENIRSLKFFNSRELCWARRTDYKVDLASERGHEKKDAYPQDAVVSMAYFNGDVHAACRGEKMYSYNGKVWSEASHDRRPAFLRAMQSRLAIAGFAERPSRVEFSRVNEPGIFPVDEESGSSEATRAGYIDIGNLTNAAGGVTALGEFEPNRLAIFTADEALVYKIVASIDEWGIDERANVGIGCVSNRSIARAGSSLIFASRWGVHMMRRSDNNGLTIGAKTLSDRIERLYREYLLAVEDPQMICGIFDQDWQQYHLFFPMPGGMLAKRLTFNFDNTEDSGYWTTGDILNATCADNLAGQLVLGTPGGPWNVGERFVRVESDDPSGNLTAPTSEIVTPIMWLGDSVNKKRSKHLILQASGKGDILVEAYDHMGRELHSHVITLQAQEEDATFPIDVLENQHDIPFDHTFIGLQLKFTVTSETPVVITSYAIDLHGDY